MSRRRLVALGVGGALRQPVSVVSARSLHVSPTPGPREDISQLPSTSSSRPNAVRSFQVTRQRRNSVDGKQVPDNEWELRVGRGIYVLTSTLPTFFDTGLITNASHDDSSQEDISIYSDNIELSYTPPAALPSPLPQTLRTQGMTMYQGSASVLRSTFTALYSNCSVTLDRMSVVPGGFRERKVKIDITLEGTSRLTGTKAEWNVLSTYSFSPASGLVLKHEIERIYPAPHSALIDSVRANLLRLMGVKASENPSATIGGPCAASPAPVSRTSKSD